MKEKVGRGIQKFEGEVYKRTGVSSTGFRQKKIRMEVDVLDYAIGGVLFMECEDGRWRPVDFLSKSLNKTEKNYKIINKEILVVIRELKN